MSRRLLIRADATAEIGAGHVMRSLAIIEEHDGEAVLFAQADPLVEHIVARWPVAMAPGGELLDAVRYGDTVVIDGYHFGHTVYQSVADLGAVVVGVGDRGSVPEAAPVHVVVDQSSRRSELPRYPGAVVLAGPRNSLVRSEFRHARRVRGGHLRKVLVAMGGSDPLRLGPDVAAAIAGAHSDLEVTLLVGPAADAPSARGNIAVVRSPSSVAAVADGVDLAVTAAGTAAWEFACMGLPLVAIALTENQRSVGDRLGAAGVAVDAASQDAVSVVVDVIEWLRPAHERRRRSQAALDLVDGRGPQRVLTATTRAVPMTQTGFLSRGERRAPR